METVATELRYLCVGGRVCPRSYLRLARARTQQHPNRLLPQIPSIRSGERAAWPARPFATPTRLEVWGRFCNRRLCRSAAARSRPHLPPLPLPPPCLLSFPPPTQLPAALSRLRARSESTARPVRRTRSESGDSGLIFSPQDAQIRLIGPGLNRTKPAVFNHPNAKAIL